MSNLAPQRYTKHPDETRAATYSFRHKLSPGDTLSGTPTIVVSPSGLTVSNIALNAAVVEGDYILASANEAV